MYVLSYCADFIDKFKIEDTNVQTFVSKQFALMTKRPNVSEEIECALSLDETEGIGKVLETMKRIAEYQSIPLRTLTNDTSINLLQGALFT